MTRTALNPDAFQRELAARGLTQVQFAELCGLTDATVSHAATGHRLNVSTVVRIGAALRRTPTLPGLPRLLVTQVDTQNGDAAESGMPPAQAGQMHGR
ncbi:MAG: helix-turn-helix domain-containing protein [Candidatus Dormibacteria bacterium]